ncbi:MAG: PQQ-binding-like beta-propeller repeat protein [candidate division Zixibacteria bacterium]|jgi:outer membrane protein assembly factor BamB|nr:PQQ-binding-like beta-propeller repeat protein [candidate division Zixibacteria bacterium]
MYPSVSFLTRLRATRFVVVLSLAAAFVLPSALLSADKAISGEPLWIFDANLQIQHLDTASLNGDLVPDIIAAEHDNSYYGELSRVWAIDGATGDTIWQYVVWDAIRGMAVGDIDGDGVADVAVAASYNASSTPDGRIHAINGATGTPFWTFPTGNTNESVTIANINGGTHLDVVASSFDDFVYAIDGQTGGLIWSEDIGSLWVNKVAAADVNGDGTDDVAYAHEYLTGFTNRQGIIDGATGNPIWDSVVTYVNLDVLIADVDDDGQLEAVFSGIGGDDKGRLVVRTALTGALEWEYFLGTIDHVNGEIPLYIRDVDNDLDLDIVIGNYLGWYQVIAFDGEDGAPIFISDTLDGFPRGLAFGDVTGEGDLDIVAATYDRVQVLSAIDGSKIWYYSVGGTIVKTAVADLDGNDTLDVIAAGGADFAGTPPNPVRSVWALKTSVSPVLWEFPFGEYGNAVAVGDLNGDEFADVATVCSVDDNAWAINGKDGSELWHWTGTENLYAVTIGDFNDDGYDDVAVGGADDMVTALSAIDGSILWQFTTPTNQIYRNCLASADLDGDGAMDVIAGSDDSRVYAIKGTSGAELWSRDVGTQVGEIELADMNGTGPIDVVVAVESGTEGEKMVVLDGSDGSILWDYPAGDAVQHVEALDANGDGTLDVALGRTPYAPTTVIVVDGVTHTELWSEAMPIPSNVHGFGHGDLDGDLSEDLVVPGNSTDRKVYAKRGYDGHELWSFTTGGEVNCLLVEDMNNDGQLDVIVGSDDQYVYVLDGSDGSVWWSFSTADDVMHLAIGDISGNYAPNITCVTFGSDGVVYAFESFYDGEPGCCIGTTGNVNDDAGGAVDLSDLIYLVNFLFLSGPPPACPAAANINGDAGCAVDLSDLIYLVNFLFLSGPSPADCLPQCE